MTVQGRIEAADGWRDATGLFDATELRVIALAAASPGDCTTCHEETSWIARTARRLSGVLALHRPAPLANPRLEALRLLVCAALAGRGGDQEKALAAGLSDDQIAEVAKIAAAWRR